MKRLYIFLFILVVIIILGTVYISWQYTRANKNVAEETPDYSLVPEALISEIKADRNAAVKKYENRIISLSGIVDEKENDDIFFEKEGVSIQCQMRKQDALNIMPKQQVKVKAKFVGVSDDDINGTEIQLNNGVLEK